MICTMHKVTSRLVLSLRCVDLTGSTARISSKWKFAVTFFAFRHQRKLPDEGWSDLRIQLLLQELSIMDSNNFSGGPCMEQPAAVVPFTVLLNPITSTYRECRSWREGGQDRIRPGGSAALQVSPGI